jgi:hypothetical protein
VLQNQIKEANHVYATHPLAVFAVLLCKTNFFPVTQKKHSPATADTGRRVSGANQTSPHGKPDAGSGLSPESTATMEF